MSLLSLLLLLLEEYITGGCPAGGSSSRGLRSTFRLPRVELWSLGRTWQAEAEGESRPLTNSTNPPPLLQFLLRVKEKEKEELKVKTYTGH